MRVLIPKEGMVNHLISTKQEDFIAKDTKHLLVKLTPILVKYYTIQN